MNGFIDDPLTFPEGYYRKIVESLIYTPAALVIEAPTYNGLQLVRYQYCDNIFRYDALSSSVEESQADGHL